ncbi:hypothetical protein OXX79_005433 [Metschnikowia pulcherrima]
MTLSTIYVARHGYRSNWLPPPHPPNPTGIDSDPVLAPHGVDQAVELSHHIGKLPEEEKPQFIVSSPFYRCVETAQPTARVLGLKVAVDRGVGEWFKTDRGVVPRPAGYDQLGEFFPEVIANAEIWDGSGVVPSESGETSDDIFARCQRFWAEFLPSFEKQYPAVSSILIVTHAATKIALGMSLLDHQSVNDEITFNGEKTKIRAGACSIDKFVREQDSWTLKENGRTDFLKDGEEMNWNFDVKFEAGSDEDIKARKEAAKLAGVSEPPSKIGPELENDAYEDLYFAIDVPVVAPSFYDESSRDSGKGREGSALSQQLLINPNAKLQLTELDHETPLFKISDNANVAADPESMLFSNLSAIDGQIYKTSWTRLLGTELVFDEYGDLVGTVREHLVTDPSVKVKPKLENAVDADKDTTPPDASDTKTSFFKKAVAAAKSKK